jgi:putative transposase
VATFSRYVPVLYARFSYKGEDVVATLDRVCCQIGYPKTIRIDNVLWQRIRISEHGPLGLSAGRHSGLLASGKPTDNVSINAFNGKFRAECPNAHWFMGLEDSSEKLEAWRRDDTKERPHGAIGNKAPAALMK